MANIERFYNVLNPIIKSKDSSNTFYVTREMYNTYLQEVKKSKTIAVKNQSTIGD